MPDSSTLQSQYAVQVQKDLESNAAERERIAAELDVLQGKLKELEDNHALLTAMQQTIGSATVPAAKTRKKTSETARARRVPRARTSAETTPATGPKERQTKPMVGKPTGGRGSGPTLRDLVAEHLAGSGQPASAAEITTALVAAHPGRNIAATVVRNTLENLVAKGAAQRTRQRRSVFYSRPDTTGANASAESDDTVTGNEEAATPAAV
ncbi:hypothetical protein [Streptomyces sp. HUAS TT7]|uniref:hypothetical protein n=1 Tax=Streptomyces sp. HUAS TT7 TaxID=3447507 RepID=UPI003F657F81